MSHKIQAVIISILVHPILSQDIIRNHPFINCHLGPLEINFIGI